MLDFKPLNFNSDDHQASVKLRYKILREPLGMQFTDEELNNEVNQFHLGVFQNAVLVGVLLLNEQNNHTLKMRQVAIDINVQNQGIGSRLVVYAESFAQKQGFDRLELNARITAKKFYLNLNYKTDDLVFEEVGIPHVKMWKNLS